MDKRRSERTNEQANERPDTQMNGRTPTRTNEQLWTRGAPQAERDRCHCVREMARASARFAFLKVAAHRWIADFDALDSDPGRGAEPTASPPSPSVARRPAEAAAAKSGSRSQIRQRTRRAASRRPRAAHSVEDVVGEPPRRNRKRRIVGP